MYALKVEKAATVSVLSANFVVISFILEFAMLGTVPHWFSVLGAGLIVFSTTAITFDKMRVAKRTRKFLTTEDIKSKPNSPTKEVRWTVKWQKLWYIYKLRGLSKSTQLDTNSPNPDAAVYWSEPLDQRVPGSIPVNAWHFCHSARYFIHIAALHPGVKWVPGRMWRICCVCICL